MTNAAHDLIDRMKAANAKGNFGLPDGIVAEWQSAQETQRASGEAHYTALLAYPMTRSDGRVVLVTIPND